MVQQLQTAVMGLVLKAFITEVVKWMGDKPHSQVPPYACAVVQGGGGLGNEAMGGS